VRDIFEEKTVLLEKVDTFKNVVASLTKSMRTKKFYQCREKFGITAVDF
jgi:hypothetical protein